MPHTSCWSVGGGAQCPVWLPRTHPNLLLAHLIILNIGALWYTHPIYFFSQCIPCCRRTRPFISKQSTRPDLSYSSPFVHESTLSSPFPRQPKRRQMPFSSPLSTAAAEIKPYFALLVASLQFVPTHYWLTLYHLYQLVQSVPTHCFCLSVSVRGHTGYLKAFKGIVRNSARYCEMYVSAGLRLEKAL